MLRNRVLVIQLIQLELVKRVIPIFGKKSGVELVAQVLTQVAVGLQVKH